MKNIMKIFATIMVMVMVLTSSAPIVTEAKTKTSITVTNKATGKKVGKKITLKAGQKLQLKVMYGKKNVTKKAKYKASNKHVTVSKKGKITAKTKGVSTVTITYKKKTKKIKVTVTAKSTTEKQSTEEKKTIEQIIEDCKLKDDPHPECDHMWDLINFHADISIDFHKNFFDLYQDHLFLAEMNCSKCDAVAITTPVPVTEALEYTNEELNNTILYYLDTISLGRKIPKHKHKYVEEYGPVGEPGQWTGQWGHERKCSICRSYDD